MQIPKRFIAKSPKREEEEAELHVLQFPIQKKNNLFLYWKDQNSDDEDDLLIGGKKERSLK